MDDNLDINKFMKICQIIMTHSRTKTLDARLFQSATQILCMDDLEQTKRAIFSGTKYYYEQKDNKLNILTYNHYNNLIRNFIDENALDIFGYKPRLDPDSIVYFCGVADALNDRVQKFNN